MHVRSLLPQLFLPDLPRVTRSCHDLTSTIEIFSNHNRTQTATPLDIAHSTAPFSSQYRKRSRRHSSCAPSSSTHCRKVVAVPRTLRVIDDLPILTLRPHRIGSSNTNSRFSHHQRSLTRQFSDICLVSPPRHSDMGVYADLNKDKSYHQCIFLSVALGLAGLCSIYPVACFKKISGKERAKLNNQIKELDRHQKEDEDWEQNHHPRRARHRSHSRARTSRRPHHHHQSSRDHRHEDERHHETKGKRRRVQDHEMLPQDVDPHRRWMSHTSDRQWEQEKPQPRRHAHDPWEGPIVPY
jgi:hypothetical protein